MGTLRARFSYQMKSVDSFTLSMCLLHCRIKSVLKHMQLLGGDGRLYFALDEYTDTRVHGRLIVGIWDFRGR